MKTNTDQAIPSTTYTKKLSLTAGSLSALCLLPLASQAAIVHQTTPIGISLADAPNNGSGGATAIDWDVDGDSNSDFFLLAFRTSLITTTYYGSTTATSATGTLMLNSNSQNGWGMVQAQGDNTNKISNLSLGFQVGSILSTAYQWSPAGIGNRELLQSSNYSYNASPPFNGNTSEYLGFRFKDAGNQTLYGWAEINLDDADGVMTINQWAYEDSGASIAVGQVSAVPVPPAFLSMLSGLALGAGGVLRSRRQRKAAESRCEKTVGQADI